MLLLVKSNLVKLATSRTVILPPTVSALCCVNRKRLRVSIVVVAESLCKRERVTVIEACNAKTFCELKFCFKILIVFFQFGF